MRRYMSARCRQQKKYAGVEFAIEGGALMPPRERFRPSKPVGEAKRNRKVTFRVTDEMKAEIETLVIELGYAVESEFVVDLINEGLPKAREEAKRRSGK